MEEYDITPQDQEHSGLPSIVISEDRSLVVWYKSTQEDVEHAYRVANDLVITDEQKMTDAVNIRNTYRVRCKEVLERIGFHKDRVNKLHDQIMAVEKELAGDARKKDGGYQLAMEMITKKINARLDQLERERVEEEARLNKLAEADRTRRMGLIAKALDKLQDGLSDLNEQKRVLEERITGNPDITIEEAEEIRARINTIDARLQATTTRVEEKQAVLEQVTAPSTIVVDNAPKVEGLSSRLVWVAIRIDDDDAVHLAVPKREAPRSACTWSLPKFSQYGNDQVKGTNRKPVVPGVVFEQRRITSTRGA